jgi:hypothetical protein
MFVRKGVFLCVLSCGFCALAGPVRRPDLAGAFTVDGVAAIVRLASWMGGLCSNNNHKNVCAEANNRCHLALPHTQAALLRAFVASTILDLQQQQQQQQQLRRPNSSTDSDGAAAAGQQQPQQQQVVVSVVESVGREWRTGRPATDATVVVGTPPNKKARRSKNQSES